MYGYNIINNSQGKVPDNKFNRFYQVFLPIPTIKVICLFKLFSGGIRQVAL